MSVIVLTPEIITEIATAIERARERVIPWDVLRDTAVDDHAAPTTLLTLEERGDFDGRPQSQFVRFPGGVEAAVSFEQQPAGICRHLSVSTGRPGKVLDPVMFEIVAREFGFGPMIEGKRQGRAWVEEYEPGKYAINVVQIEIEPEAGHA